MANGGNFRNRESVLGDIVNSDPLFVGEENFLYGSLPGNEGSSYSAYLTSKALRTKIVYVGANDGMLHAFAADTGIEKFAFIPSEVIPQLTNLSTPDYGDSIAHKYFVDGSPKSGDVYIDADGNGNKEWRTILLAPAGAGGRSITALDVTDPDNFAAANVLWEFTDNSDADLGYTLPQPSIVRMNNGVWAAIVGNGYNNATGHSMLIIINIEDGSVIKKIDTGTGSLTTSNGLGTPIAVDTNDDRIADTIYAGDLLGNLWKFDVSDINTANWKVAFDNAGTPAPLFVSKDASNVIQPITAKPQVAKHPHGGVIVFFGTGKYFETDDNVAGPSPQIQTYYGIWDNGAIVSGRSRLQEQEILAEGKVGEVNLRITSEETVEYTATIPELGWFMDLKSPINGTEAERVVSPSLLRGERIVFTTIIPQSDPCESGGTSWLMEINALTGTRGSMSPFDINNDGIINESDLVKLYDTDADGNLDLTSISGRQSTVGIIKTPAVISAGKVEYKIAIGSSGVPERVTESASNLKGRQTWWQVR